MKQMKYVFICASMALVTLSSCVKEGPEQEQLPNENPSVQTDVNVGQLSFAATAEVTKTTLGSDNVTVSWDADDKIAVFDGTPTVRMFETKEGGAEAVFEGIGSTSAAEYYALYPYSSSASMSGGKMSAKVPSVQTGNFNQHIAVAYTTAAEKSLSFKNVTAVVKFTLDEDYVTKVTLKGNNNEIIAGDLAISWNGGNPTVEVSNGAKEVSVGDGSTVMAKKDYYFVVAPQNLEGGLTLSLTYKEDPTTFTWQWGELKEQKATIGVTTIDRVGNNKANLISGTLLDLGSVNMSITIYDEGWNNKGQMYSYVGDTGFCNEVTDNPYSGSKCLEINMSSRYGFVGLECVTNNNGTLDLSAAYNAGFYIEFAVRTTSDISSSMYVSVQQKKSGYNPSDWRTVNSSKWNNDGNWQVVRLPLRAFWPWERGWLTNDTKISDLSNVAKTAPFKWDYVQRVGFEPCGHGSWENGGALKKTFYIDAIRICKYIPE